MTEILPRSADELRALTTGD